MANQIKAIFVIVGGGIAGVSCAETISFLCPDESIYLLTESSLIKTVTNLVPLGKSLTKFDIEEKDAENINRHVHVLVDILESINSQAKTIRTKNGRTIHYNYLCLCTGARPKLIEPNNPHIIGIRDTESVLEFQKRIKNSRKIALIGNGGIASEIAYEVNGIGIDWVIKDDHISSTFVDAGAAKFFQSRLKAKDSKPEKATIKRMRYTEEGQTSAANQRGAALGPDWHRKINIEGKVKDIPDSVRIHYETEIKEIKNTADSAFPIELLLTNGESIPCDFVVSATGVAPSLNFTYDQPFTFGPDGGISVDALMKTNIPDIFAAGDICYASWDRAQHWFQMRLWTQARQMGAMAGKSMVAALRNEEITQDFCFELFGHVTNLFGYQVVLLGKYNGQGLGNRYEMLVRVTPDLEYIKYVLVDGRLQGAILIGETGLEETSENLILNQLDLTPYGDDILNPDIDIEDYFD